MSRSGLAETQSVLDVLQSWNWDLVIPRIPGVGDTRPLTYKCISTTIPGSQIEQVPLEIHGVKLNYAGRRVWGGTWEATFIESRDSNTRQQFLTWMDLMRSWVTNTGMYKSVYAVPIELALYDDLPTIVRSIKLVNAFPTQLGDVTLDQSAGIIQYQVTFSYDMTEES